MKRTPQVESGLQLLSRLSKRPSIKGLNDRLFDGGPRIQETVEISGNSSSGKTLLLTQLIAKCILPSMYDGIAIGGLGAGVLLINTDHHFRVSKLVRLMHYIVKSACRKENTLCSDSKIKELVINPSLDNLTVIHCYDNSQFKLTLDTLDDILLKDLQISLIAVDSISTFYWQDRDIGGVWLIDQYLKNVLKTIQKYVFQYNIAMIYTRPDDFSSKTITTIELAIDPTDEKINYRIYLGNSERGFIETAEKKIEITFKIEFNGIIWSTEAR